MLRKQPNKFCRKQIDNDCSEVGSSSGEKPNAHLQSNPTHSQWRFTQWAGNQGSPVHLRHDQHALLIVFWLVIAFGAVLHYGVAARQKNKMETPHGRYCAQQVLSLADRLYPHLTQRLEGQTGMAEYQETLFADTLYWHTWDVLYSDNQGMDMAYFKWNADTGQLLSVSTTRPLESPTTAQHFLRSDEAVSTCLCWLQELGMIVSQGPVWHLAEPPERCTTAWVLCFVSGTHKIIITVDAANGKLRQAQMR